MLFSLARRGDAPKSLLEINRRGVPVKAILLTSSIGFLSTGLAYLSPETVFLFLVNSSGAIALLVAVIGAMALIEDVRPQLIPSFISLAIVLAAYRVKTRPKHQQSAVPAGAA